MSINYFLKLIGKRIKTIITIMIIFLAAAIIVCAVQPFKYGSSLKLLTINSFKENTDPYVASRSNEYLSNLLAQIIYSNSFFEKVKESGFNIDGSYFSGEADKQMKKWKKTVSAKGIADTGMISIEVFHTDRAQAEEIARAIAYALQTSHTQYHGFGKGVEIKIIDEPITSSLPVKPNVPLNLGLAVIFGLIFSLCYIYLLYEDKSEMVKAPEEAEEPETFAEIAAPDTAVYQEEAESPISKYAQILREEKGFEEQGSMDNILKR